MTKRFLTTALSAVVVCVAATASATQTRINSLGGGVKQFTVLDDRNIFLLPAEIVKYGTWTDVEIGGPGFNSFAIHYNFTPSVVLGIYGSSEQQSAVTLGGGDLVIDQSGDAANKGFAPNHKGTVFLGFDLGSTRLGFALGIWGSKDKNTNKTDQVTNNVGPLVIDFKAGVGFSVGSGDLDLGLDIRYGTPTDEGLVNDASTTRSDNSQFDMGLLGRLTVPFSGPHELVPFLGIHFAHASGKKNVDNANTLSGNEFDATLGIDIRLNLGEGIIVQPGAGLRFGYFGHTLQPSEGDPTDTSVTDLVIPFYNVAVDVKVTDWFDIRFGGAQEVQFNMQSAKTGPDKSDNNPSKSTVKSTIATGVGFNLPAGVAIDIDVDVNWWKSGPSFITGDNNHAFGLSAAISKDW